MDWLAKRKRTEKMVLVALFSALTWIGAYLRIEIIPPCPLHPTEFYGDYGRESCSDPVTPR